MILRIQEDIPTAPIELHVQSSGDSEEEQFFTRKMTTRRKNIYYNAKGRLGPTQQIKYPIFHSNILLHTNVITTTFQHCNNYQKRPL